MQLKINKEIRDFKESIFFGLSMRQFIFSAFACGIAIFLYFTFIDKLGMELTSWVCMIGALPFAAIGFITIQGMTFERFLIDLFRSILLYFNPLEYVPYNYFYELTKKRIEIIRKESMKYNDKKSIKDAKAK
ncbi:PrgI family protein [Faecalitalea cylindroides]|uniref:PrgI family protein n=1 Tax=Faecalitalea cylindroides ATCC 27803 TaxID=649755 RepID=U2R813_9FIRM|nr:PrgI family protein [Faecalitalea cylindroides]ERK46842.1 hypothetical protein HMPREF0367_00335 [[Eubacterium] cylindroides ATCC 27803] [Faecalitalea cylindroides ATCC 27803]